MKKIVIIIIALLLCSTAWAAQNKKHSFKDFTHRKFVNVDAKEFNNSEIVGTCFYQEGDPDQDVFPAGMTGVTFKRCNLDNVKIPAGNFVVTEGWEKCSTRSIKVQNDLEDWILDAENKPVEPVSKEFFIEKGISIDPKDIPAEGL